MPIALVEFIWPLPEGFYGQNRGTGLQSGLRLRSTLVEQGSRVLILFFEKFGKMSRCPKKIEKWSKNMFPENVQNPFPWTQDT